LGFGATPTQLFGVNTIRLGRFPLDFTPFETISSLQSKLQASDDRQKEMSAALKFLFQRVLGEVPTEFAHLVNMQVS